MKIQEVIYHMLLDIHSHVLVVKHQTRESFLWNPSKAAVHRH